MDADASVTPSEAGLGGEGGAPSSGGSAASGDAGATSNAGEGGADNSPHGATIDARGGTVVAPDGAAVIVPEGALTGAVFVEIAQDASGAPSLPAGMPPLGPIYAFTPHGIQFAEPVTVHVPFDPAAVPSGVRPVLLQAEPGGAFAQIPAQLDGSVLSATVSSFSWFVVARVGAIAAGYYHTCALANGGVKCWGDNSVGQLGDGSNTDSTLPIYVQGLPLIDNAVPGVTPTFVHAIATNYDYSCTLLGASYGVMCWGQNTAVTSSKTPITIPGLALAEAITTGVQHACALLPGGTVKCWGDNAYGELGNGSTNGSATPVTVSGLTGAVSISANGNTSCAVLDDGSARCWGRNDGGQLGDGSLGGNGAQSTSPVTVRNVADAASISLGWNHGCALLTNGTARCWGQGDVGQLGDGSNTSSSTPLAVSGLSNAIAISAGLDYTCALLSNGTVACWGEGKPLSVIPGLSDVATVSVGFDHRCAMLSDGNARCWGENAKGQLGDGSTKASSAPVPVPLSGGTSGNGGNGGSGGSGGTSGSAGNGSGGGANGHCSNLTFHGGQGFDCTLTEDDGSAALEMICSAASCQCFSDGVAYGAAFDIGNSPCQFSVTAFQDMVSHCGCP